MSAQVIEQDGKHYLKFSSQGGGSLDPIPSTNPHPASMENLVQYFGWTHNFPDGTEDWLNSDGTGWLNIVPKPSPHLDIRSGVGRVRTTIEEYDGITFRIMYIERWNLIELDGPDYLADAVSRILAAGLTFGEVAPEDWDGSPTYIDRMD